MSRACAGELFQKRLQQLGMLDGKKARLMASLFDADHFGSFQLPS